jgi:hypothetical protein
MDKATVACYTLPSTMKIRSVASLFCALLFSACTPSKYASYKSVSGDYRVSVPRGWNIIADADYDAFSSAQFIGPFDPDFYLGVPSMSVRWYKSYARHRMRDGSLEMYADSQDFINQTLRQVYGSKAVLYGTQRRDDGGRAIVSQPEDIHLKESGLPAKFFGVLSPAPAPAGNRWGVDKDDQGRPVNIRLHDYAIVPVPGGFYVLCYPATLRGYDKGAELFRALVNTFHPLTAGPGGPKIRLPGK